MASAKERSLLGKGSDAYDDNDKHCQPCFLIGSTTSAESFCVNCREFLCTKCATHHQVLTAMKDHVHVKANEANKATLTAAKDKCSKKCSEHTDKSVKYFCVAHSQLGCTICFTLEHKMCREVEHIPTAATNLKEHNGFKQFDEGLENVRTAYKTSIEDLQSNLKILLADERQVQQVFNDFRKQMNNALDTLQSQVSTEVKKIKDQETKKLDALLKKLAKSQASIDALAKDLGLLLAGGKRCDAFVLAKTDIHKLSSLQEKLAKSTGGQTFQHFQFEPSVDLLKVGALGKLKTRSGGPVSSWSAPSINSAGPPTRAAVPPPRAAVQPPMSAGPPARAAGPPPMPAVNTQAAPPSRDPVSAPTTVPDTKSDDYWMAMATMIKKGDRVRRGRNWSSRIHGNKDGGPGALGTVVDKRDGRYGDRYCTVRWDNGNTGEYTMSGRFNICHLEIV